ncbi:MAG: double-strand break repair helicase AddA [Paracoccaceae bacterium]|nr:double-strand break repair helicase AddA [Paracoccaceae bacterium]
MIKSVRSRDLSSVSKPRNSMWVSANAGSGKTRNLITRVARLLLQGALPDKILCLTYTTAAATEMQDRLFKELGSWAMKSDDALTKTLLDLDENFFKKIKKQSILLNTARILFAKALETPGGLKIQTIHGFCSSVLKKFPLEINISPNFKVLDERKKQDFVNRSIVTMLNDNPKAFDIIVKLLSVSDINHFIDQILVNRSLLVEPFNRDSFCKSFELIDQDFNAQNEVAFILNGLPENIIEIVSEALLNGSSADAKQVDYLINIKSVEDLNKLEKLKNFFCTNDGKVRSSKLFPSKKAKLANPGLDTLFNKFRENFLNYLARFNQLNIINKTEAIYTFSQNFLAIYEKIKITEGFLDYEDLIIKTRDLFVNFESKWVLFKLDGGIDHILLDEAQDTSIQQWEMLASLMDDFFSDERALTGQRTFYAVGDEKQSIYSFQGADIRSFSFMKDFFSRKLNLEGNELKSVELISSFRSSKAVLSFVNEIMYNGGGTGVKNIRDHIAYHEDLPGRVELWPLLTETEQEESNAWWTFKQDAVQISGVERLADSIAINIKNTLASNQTIFDPNTLIENSQRKVLPGDFLILVRSRGPLFKSILKKLTDYSLPVSGSDRLLLLDELAIKDIISLLKFLTNRFDDLSLAEALRSPLLGVSEELLFEISYQRNCSLYESLKLNFPDHAACFILDALLVDVKVLSPYELIERVLINHSGRLRMTARLGMSINDILDDFLIQALTYEEEEPPSIFGFLLWLEGTQVAVKRQLQNDSLNIRVMTIHGSKGLEAPIVIIPDTFYKPRQTRKRLFLQKAGWLCFCDDGPCLPDEIKKLKDQKLEDDREEENRLFYVAITRARNWLIICGLGKKEAHLRSNWYYQSQMAFNRLAKKEPSLIETTKERKLVFEHNWTSNTYGNSAKDKDEWALNSNKEDFSKRLRTLLLNSLRLTNEIPSSLSVSELVDKFSSFDGINVDKESYSIAPGEGTTFYGSLVHLFLQLLPIYSNKDITYVKEIAYKKFKDELKDFDILDTALRESQRVLENVELRELLRHPDSFREVPVSSLLALPKAFMANEKEHIRIRGRIDLLNVTKSKVLIVDYKTNLRVPSSIEGINPQILSQLELYSRILQKTYPSQKISSAILWTKTANLMIIPRMNSKKALNSFFVNQVLDGG